VLKVPIDDLFKAVRVVHPKAYLVLRSLIKAYPKDHFKACMQEAVGMDLISHETKRQLKEAVEFAVNECNKKLVDKIMEF
jgi:hypothetical protein